jgi:hypothetical protein
MTANGVTASGGIYSYDFSIAESQVHGGNAGYNNVTGSVWGMVAGDANRDGLINLSDKTQWAAFAGQRGYIDTDFTMDTQVNNNDKNDKWLSNTTKTEQIPD